MSKVRAGLAKGDYVLIGVDLVKNAGVLEAAYDDAAGITAKFNKNLLNVLNHKLGGEFDPDLFAHRVIYDTAETRIEMWLDSEVKQKVPMAALDLEIPFEAGEGIRTEISTKFTPDSVHTSFREAGFRLLHLYTDAENLFGLALGEPT